MSKTYFLGSPSPEGFTTHFQNEIKSGLYTYIIKGGPGTGKSSFMKRLGSELSDICEPEYYCCSSDPDSLDAVIFRGLGVIFVDGTAPHVFEPTYPGARQSIINLGEFWDEDSLKKAAPELIRLTDRCASIHTRVRRYLGAIHDLGAETADIGERAILREKLNGYSKRFSQKIFPKTQRGPGTISLKQITSLTPKGMITQQGALSGCRKFFVDDPCFTVSDALLKNLSQYASFAGYDVIASPDMRLPGCMYEELVINELKIAFVPGSKDKENGVRINAMRFYDRDKLREHRTKLAFCASLRKELTQAAVESLQEAKAVHDELEKLYISAMDFSKVEDLYREISEKLRRGANPSTI